MRTSLDCSGAGFAPTRFVPANGVDFAVHEAGTGPAIMLLHGFPELAYSWRHQLAALAAARWRAIAPDLRGYGATGPAGEVAAYSMSNLARDVVGMLDGLGVERAVIVGHDFGGMLGWTVAREHPGRVAGVISLNTPYSRRTEDDIVATMRKHRGATNYMVRFQAPGDAEALLEADVAAVFRGLMRRPAMTLEQFQAADASLRALPWSLFPGGDPGVFGEPFLGEAELSVFAEAFGRTGFTGALNWYRALRQTWLDGAAGRDHVDAPALMISARDDVLLPPTTTRGMERHVPDLERRIIEDCGHWTQQERPEQTNAAMLEWLERRMRPLLS